MRAAFIGLIVMVLAACGQPKPQEHRAELFVFGTKVDIIIRGVDADTANAATARLKSEFEHLHSTWHAWKPGEVTKLNAALAQGRAIAVSRDVLDLIAEAKTLSAMSGGRFDPAIGRLVAAWGFHNDDRPKGFHPDLATIRALAALRPRMSDVHIDGRTVSATNRTVQLDFGAFAKGAALDRAERILADQGVTTALINAGGDLNTLGGGGDKPWTIGIRDPKAWGVMAEVTLTPGEDVYTSGNYERFIEADGVRYAHIIDPATGMPVNHIVSSTVIAMDGSLADAAATALSVAGPKNWHAVAKAMGLKYVALVDDQGRLYVNPAMRERLRIAPDQSFEIVESPPL